MKRAILILVCLAACALQAARPPNVLIIFTDDHGWADLGANGVDAHIHTPNVDRLAAEGVRFPRGYVTAPQCTPSRAGLISGQYQSKIGVESNGLPLPLEVVTLPEHLKKVGYVTGISGKWHLQVTTNPNATSRRNRFLKVRDLLPHAQGFDEYFTGVMQDYTASHALDGTPYPDAPREVKEQGCRVVIQTEAALGFLKRRATNPDQPWFLYLAYMAPHTPLEWPEPWISQVPENLPKERRSALALIAAIDDGVGRVRAQIRTMGQENNTLIFYIGDNGAPLAPEDPNARRNPWDGSINLPMRGQKGMLSEGGIRVPFVAAWPGTIPGGQVFDHPVISLDVAATAVAAAGLPHPPELDGVDLLPHLTGRKQGPPHEALYWRWVDQAAIQEFPYKLLLPGGEKPLLIDITEPENEHLQHDLSDEKPDVAARLRKKLDTWLATLQPPGQPVPLAPHRKQNFIRYELVGEAPRPTEAAQLPPARVPPVAVTAPAPPEGPFGGWIVRNGQLVQSDEGLTVQRAAGDEDAAAKRLFLTRTQLNLPAPATVTLRLRARKGGPATLTWRTRQAAFTPEQKATFDWPDGELFRDVKLELDDPAPIIHIRITPAPQAEELEIQSITFTDARGKTSNWSFTP
jgi:arylsulfatase A-like enzyme